MSDRLKNIQAALKKGNRLTQLRSYSQLDRKQFFDTLISPNLSKYFHQIYDLITNNPDIFRHSDIEELSRQQERELGIKQTLKILKNIKIDLEKEESKLGACMFALSFFSVGHSTKGFLHFLLYIKTILLFKSNQYHEECLRKAKSFEDLGSFGLTQLHHGSFSRGIGTEAVYDHKTKQFVISTHGQKGMKFWIGNLGFTANKIALWALLIVDGVNYGPHCFIVQIRDSKNHQVLQGITIGECGPKNGVNLIDNGYIIINNLRLPTKTLLGKLGYVDESGKYQSMVKSNSQRFGLHMSPLSSGRASITLSTLTQSGASLAIALRYSGQRRQFKINENEEEKLIIDYPTTRFRLLLPLAVQIVSYFPAGMINRLYVQNSRNFTDPKKRIVNQLHAISAVLKVKTTWFTDSVITECRQILGGHGYSSYSRLGSFYHNNNIHTTWQGDNNLLLQQTSKYILKAIKQKQIGEIFNLNFIYDGVQKIQIDEKSLKSPSQLYILLKNIFIARYQSAIQQMSRAKDELKQKGVKKQDIQHEVWNLSQPYFCNQMALSYGDLIYFQSANNSISSYKGSSLNKEVLTKCLIIWAQSTLLKASVDGIGTRKILQKLIQEGCQSIYPHCIALTDIITPHSSIIGSPFAQEDGEGMKDYLNLLFTGRKTFGRVPWFSRIIKLKEKA